MGPLASLYAMLAKGNNDEYSQYQQGHPGFGSRALWQTRLSRMADDFPGGRMPGDDGGPIYLDGPPMARGNPYLAPYIDQQPAMVDRTTFDPTPRFRDPEQAGPEPPGRPTLAGMYRR